MARIKIITDSASDIPQYLVDKYNIGYMPICVVIDGKVHYDRYDLDGREYMKSLSEREEIPTTSMVPMEWMEKEFKSNLEDSIIRFLYQCLLKQVVETMPLIF